MEFLNSHQLAFIFGLLGNIVSFLVFLAPVPTFYAICKKKSSDGFHSIPYIVALASAMLLLYYGILKTNATLIIIINAIGCVIEVTYLTIFLIFASRKPRMFTVKLLVVFNLGGYGLMMVLTFFFLKGQQRIQAVGWICATFNIAVFAAPLSIMKKVIQTKSVEFMPFTLSFFLTLCATMWFFYGIFVKDLFIAVPNVPGFLFGVAQMILYLIYKDGNKNMDESKLSKQNKATAEKKVSVIDGAKLHPSKNEPRIDEMGTFVTETPRGPSDNNV